MITAVRDRSNTTEFVRALMRNWVPVEATTNSLRTATRDPVNRDADFGSVGENLQNLSTTYAQLPRYLPTLFPARAGLTGFYATGLDPYIRNTGVTTVIITGSR